MPSEPISGGTGSRPPAAPPRRSRRRTGVLLAWPSAVILTMGLSAPLALAEPHPENPFQDGPCVEVPDPAEAEAEVPEAEVPETVEAETEAAAEAEGGTEPTETAGHGESPADSGADEQTGGSGGEQSGGEESGAEEAAANETAEEAAEAAPAPNPLDPLGLGDALRDVGRGIVDFFTPDRDRGSGDQEDTENAPADTDGEAASGEATSGDSAEENGETGDGTPADAAEPVAPVDEPADTSEPLPGGTEPDGPGDDVPAEADPFAPDADGKVPFPCPEEKRVAGTDEELPHLLPDDPWTLDASYLTLRGLSYHGVVNITTADGTVKQALKFTADELDIGDLHQIVPGEDGLRYHVQAAEGSKSTFRDGQVTMYTERLEGRLFGLIPVTFDPEHEPPLDLPFIHFTEVLITQAAQFGGTLSIPGMRQYLTQG